MKINVGNEENNIDPLKIFFHFSQTIKNTKDSIETIRILCNWLKSTLSGYACAYASLLTDTSLGLEWVAWYPEDIFTNKVHEADFSHKILEFTLITESTIYSVSQLKAFNKLTSNWIEKHQIQEALTLPFIFEQDKKGVFLVYRQLGQPKFSEKEVEFASVISKLISRILELHFKLESSEQKIIELDQMLLASLSMTDSLNQQEVLNAILKNALTLLP
jgi:hypothetical protein